jgi:phospholipid-translocating ATPase
VKQLTDITKLLTKSRSEAEKLHAILLYFYYSSGLIGMTMFFYNWFCYFTATSLHTSLMVLLYSFLFVTFNGLLLNFMH